jgi:hypothetical protein
VPGPAFGQLGGVSCTGSSACLAVGSSSSSSTARPLAERWDGSSWLVQQPPPGGFGAVSCSSDQACTAVNGGATAVRWNGTRWQIQRVPSPPPGGVWAVSCPSDSACIALAGNGVVPAAATWTGNRWSSQPIPRPNDPMPRPEPVNALSCASSSSCLAVGYDMSPSQDDPASAVAKVWNGHQWSDMSPDFPYSRPNGDPPTSALNGVSCSSSQFCIAVGQGNWEPLIDRWDGSHWSGMNAPSLDSGQYGSLLHVSCASTETCIALGVPVHKACR